MPYKLLFVFLFSIFSICVAGCANTSEAVKSAPIEKVGCMHVQILIGSFPIVGPAFQSAVYVAAQRKADEVFARNKQKFCGVSEGQLAVPDATHFLKIRALSGGLRHQERAASLDIEFELVSARTNAVLWKSARRQEVRMDYDDGGRLRLIESLLNRTFEILHNEGLIVLETGFAK
jgi:hypothetical protein